MMDMMNMVLWEFSGIDGFSEELLANEREIPMADWSGYGYRSWLW
jgi:hypothetical protein